MNVFISADIEGTCGITDWSETERSTPYDYNYFRKQMTMEVRAACEGAVAGGADEIFVRDAHDSARNIDPSQLPERGAHHAGLERGSAEHDERPGPGQL